MCILMYLDRCKITENFITVIESYLNTIWRISFEQLLVVLTWGLDWGKVNMYPK